MGRKRQLEKQEEIKNKILTVARKIIVEKGVDALSIRKITNALDYSPGIIYHYFKDKDEIIETLAISGYQDILASQKVVEENVEHPEKEMMDLFKSYIETVLKNAEAYKTFMLSNNPNIMKKTSVLKQGISKESKTIQRITKLLERGIGIGRFRELDVELTAQVIWSGAFGLTMRLILEEHIGIEQRNRLINHYFNVVFEGILKK